MRMRRRLGSPALNDTNYKISAARNQLCQKMYTIWKRSDYNTYHASLDSLVLSYQVNSNDWLSPALTINCDHMPNHGDGIDATLSSSSQLGDRSAMPRTSQAARALCADLGVGYHSMRVRSSLFRDLHMRPSQSMASNKNNMMLAR